MRTLESYVTVIGFFFVGVGKALDSLVLYK